MDSLQGLRVDILRVNDECSNDIVVTTTEGKIIDNSYSQ